VATDDIASLFHPDNAAAINAAWEKLIV